MEFLLFIAFLILLVSHVRLQGRVERIEDAFASARASIEARQSVTPSAPPVTPSVPPPPPSVAPTPPSAPRTSPFIEWLAEDWLVKVGAFLLLIGFAWFVSYAFANNWIGPMGRIALGLIAGALFMVFGWARMGVFVRQGSIFLALGTSVVILTTYAARSAYDFFTPTVAVAIMFFAILFSVMASLRMRTQWLAWMSACGAYVIPLLAASHEVHELQLFSYLFLVTLGVLWVVFVTDWRRIFFTALIAVSCYSLPFWMSGFITEGGLIIYGYVFVVLFFLANLAGFLTLTQGRSAQVEIIGAIAVAIMLSGWTHVGIGVELQSLVYAVWAIVFLVGAYVFAVRIRQPIAFFVYGGVGVVLIGIATALEFEGPALAIAFLLESTVAILLAQMVSGARGFLQAAYMTFLVPLLLALESVSNFPSYPAPLNGDVVVSFLTVLALGVIGWRARRIVEVGETEAATWGGAFLTVGGFSLFVFLWNLLHALMSNVIATQASLFLSILTGVVLYMTYQHPTTHGERALRFAGLLLVLFVIGHLLLIEVWGMGIVPRIMTFFVIGLFLMGTAFMKKIKQ